MKPEAPAGILGQNDRTRYGGQAAVTRRQRSFPAAGFGRHVGAENTGILRRRLDELHQRLDTAALPAVTQEQAACCYARSNKHWTVDPQGLAWESFHSLDTIPMFGADDVPAASEPKASACCAPAVESVKVAFPAPRRPA